MKWISVGEFKRVSKRVAEKRYDAGEVIYMCPSKLRPGEPWHPEVAVTKRFDSGDAKMMFEHDVARFEYYNCTYSAGYYAAFYIKDAV